MSSASENENMGTDDAGEKGAGRRCRASSLLVPPGDLRVRSRALPAVVQRLPRGCWRCRERDRPSALRVADVASPHTREGCDGGAYATSISKAPEPLACWPY
jgi:hypothetical protein